MAGDSRESTGLLRYVRALCGPDCIQPPHRLSGQGLPDRIPGNFTCPQQYQRLVIGADGLVMKCSNDEENREIIGDVKSETVHAVWHGPKMKAVRELHRRRHGVLENAGGRECFLPP